ncbi:MAG: glycosyl transferase family 90 [Rhabdochlamydiaceae bacterium]|nr:glycosyl transferase family 90 [Candidatus Amphrikana amoebophyrae]
MKWLISFLCILFSQLQAYEITPQDLQNPKYEWMTEAIERSLSHFTVSGISLQAIDQAHHESKPYINRYKVINNHVYGFGACSKLLEELTKHIKLDDVDFLYFEGDGPINEHELPLANCPILVGSKNKHLKKAICFHDRYFMNEKSFDKNWSKISSFYKNIELDWDKKIDKLIWRGNTVGPSEIYSSSKWENLHRGRLVDMSIKRPDIIDAKFTKLSNFKENEYQILMDKMQKCFDHPLSLEKQFQYRYQIVMDGKCAPFPEIRSKLLSNSILFKPNSKFVMWYSSQLQPYQHYVPVENNLSNLGKQILWAKENCDEAKQIAKRGRQFALDHLMPKDILIYSIKLLQSYAKKQQFEPAI